MKHTKGPWALSHDDLIINAETGDNICVLSGGLSLSNSRKFDNYQANAKLIAAAPEMLEVIDECSNRIAYCIELYELPEEAIAMLRGEIDALMRAIEKATE